MVKSHNCVVMGCNSDKDTQSHTFPNPSRFSDRFRSWLSLTGNRDLLALSAMTIHTTRRICYKHFKEIDRIGGRVRNRVLPTLNLPEPIPFEEVFPSLASTPEITPLDVGSLSKEETTISLPMHTLESSWKDHDFDTGILEQMPVSVYDVEFRNPNAANSPSELRLSPELQSPSPPTSPVSAPFDCIEDVPVKKCKTEAPHSECDLNQEGLLNFVRVNKNGELIPSEKFACNVDNLSHKKSEYKNFRCKKRLELAIEMVDTNSFDNQTDELMGTNQLETMKKQLRQNKEEIKKSNEKVNKLEEEIVRKELIWAKEKKEIQERLNALENMMKYQEKGKARNCSGNMRNELSEFVRVEL